MIIDTDKYIDMTTTAKMLGVTTRRISALVQAQRLGETIRIGHTRLIPIEAVQNFKRLPPGVKQKADSKEIITKALREIRQNQANAAPPNCGQLDSFGHDKLT